jgi:exosortase
MTQDFETLYWLVFFSLVLLLLGLERVRRLQRAKVRIANRWASNIGLFLLGSLASTLVLPIGIYTYAAQRGPGLMAHLGMPLVAQAVATFLLLDLWKYWEHRAFHRLSPLWRAHLVHHTDTHVDVLTSERHHPLEVVLGVVVLMALVAALAPPAPALGLYLVTATAVALGSHANVRLPAWLGRPLGWIVVTPSVHAVHHSVLRVQTDSNFGAVLTLWDRLFGTFVDPARARIPHFGLQYFHHPADARLWPVLQQPFRFQRQLDYPPRDDRRHVDSCAEAREGAVANATRPSFTPATRAALLAGLVGLVLVTWALGPTAVELAAVWSRSEAYQYAWLVPPMAAYLLLQHEDVVTRSLDARPGWAGLIVVIVAAVAWSAAMLVDIDVGRQLALVLALQGIALATLGWRAFRRVFPVLALLFLMVPSGDLLQPFLRELTVRSIDLFAWVVQLPHEVDGFVVHVGTHRYIVVDECAGLGYVTLATFLGYCFGTLLDGSLRRAVGLALLGAVLAVVCNIVRVNAIVLVDWLRGSQMDLNAHVAVQWIVLLVTIGGLLLALAGSRAPERKQALPCIDACAPVPAHDRWAPVASSAALGVIVALAAVQARQEPLPEAPGSLAFPAHLAGWPLVAPGSDWVADEGRGTRSTRARYRDAGGERDLVVIHPAAIGAKLQAAALAPGERSLWREKAVARETGCSRGTCMDLVHVTWLRDGSHELRHAYFTYRIGDSYTDSRLALRLAQGWGRLTGVPARAALIAARSDDVLDAAEVAAAIRALRSGTIASETTPVRDLRRASVASRPKSH